jgi:hypothetical protein
MFVLMVVRKDRSMIWEGIEKNISERLLLKIS